MKIQGLGPRFLNRAFIIHIADMIRLSMKIPTLILKMRVDGKQTAMSQDIQIPQILKALIEETSKFSKTIPTRTINLILNFSFGHASL